MELSFCKYQGTGNDFVILDGLRSSINLNSTQVKFICDRHFGIGADGLIILQKHENYDFEMIYFNSDGHLSSMCGNGGRCIVAFAEFIGHIKHSCQFLAVDGLHQGMLLSNGEISLKMTDVFKWSQERDAVVLNSGSPHYVRFVHNLLNENIVSFGKSIRYSEKYQDQGINVNLVESNEEVLKILTYERGVEDETYSCGTGVVAAVLADHIQGNFEGMNRIVKAKGGTLQVSFDLIDGAYKNIWLTGPATLVYEGKITLPVLS